MDRRQSKVHSKETGSSIREKNGIHRPRGTAVAGSLAEALQERA